MLTNTASESLPRPLTVEEEDMVLNLEPLPPLDIEDGCQYLTPGGVWMSNAALDDLRDAMKDERMGVR
jgi:hypothetical protein